MIGDSNYNVLDVIKNKLSIVLDKTFKEPYRKKLDIYHDRIGCCCPICGDSRTDIRKKRGNLYLDSLSYHCYNCGAHMGINALLKRFDESLDTETQIVVHEIQQNAKKFEKKTSATQTSMSFLLLTKLGVPKPILFKTLEIVSPYKNEFASNYLKSRKIDIKNWKYFAFNTNTKELYILNTTPDDRVIGYQIRQLDPNSPKERYMSTRLSKMYRDHFNKDINQIIERLLHMEKLGDKYIEDEDGVENITANLDRLSGMFNIMNVNLNQTLTVMEGPIDSLGIPNSIALQGASKKLNGFFDELENVRYLFDNDITGKDMSLKKLKDHKNVFLWGMYLNTISTRDNKIKDINDLQKKDLFNIENIEKCFSNDEFDVMYI